MKICSEIKAVKEHSISSSSIVVIMVQKRMVSIQDPKKGKEEPTQETKGRSIVSLKDLANSFKVKVLIFVIVIFILVMIVIMIISSGIG